MMLGAGKLSRRIVVERSTSIPNELNEPIETWTELLSVRAARTDVSDGEKFAAGGIGGYLAARFIVRASMAARAIRFSDRIVHEGRVWNIKGIKEPAEGRRRFLEITANVDAD